METSIPAVLPPGPYVAVNGPPRYVSISFTFIFAGQFVPDIVDMYPGEASGIDGVGPTALPRTKESVGWGAAIVNWLL